MDIARKRYNRNAFIYDLCTLLPNFFSSRTRREILNETRGKVLEIGVGTGANIPLYPPGNEYIGIDISEKMLLKAKKRLKDQAMRGDLIHMDVQNLAFCSDTFDTVITTCVFCSVTSPIEGLKEIGRVLKKDGRLIMLEHVISKNRVMAFFMNLFNPIGVKLFGANINRDTARNITKAGLKLYRDENLFSDILKIFEAGEDGIGER